MSPGSSASIRVGPCLLAVDPAQAIVVPDATNGDAYASLTLTMPAVPALRGVEFIAQAAIVDAASPIGITLSGGQTLRVGG